MARGPVELKLRSTDYEGDRRSSLRFFSLREAIFFVLANNLPRLWIFDRYRYVFYRLAGMRIGKRCTLYGPVTIRPYGGCSNVSIGDRTFLNVDTAFCVVYDSVTIGNNVQVGPRVAFETMGHGIRYVPSVGRGRTSAPIVVEDEVWIGANSLILQGVTIGRGSVVAAGAVVSSNVPPGVVVGGVPARILRVIEEDGVALTSVGDE